MSRPTAVGCHIFAGGFTAGVRRYFDVLAHLETSDYGVATAQANFKGLPVHTDIRRWPLRELRARGVDFVYSNPPCAAWSSAGMSTSAKWETDPRVDCARQSFGLLEALRPKVWCWESVTRAFTTGRPLVDQLTAKALGLGYAVTQLFVNAWLLGVPQRRKRFFLVAHQVTLDFRLLDVARPSAAAVIKSCPAEPRPRVPESLRQILRDTYPGDGLLETFNRLHPEVKRVKGEKVRGRPPFLYFRLPKTGPSYTLTGSSTAFHPTQDRFLSVPECAALCGYPRDFKVLGSLGQQYAQLAQAVMPPVGAWLAHWVRFGLSRNTTAKPTVNLVDLRKED